MAKDPIYPNALELVQKMSNADYFGSDEDKKTRKKSGSFVPSEMYYTDEEKKDRFGGSVGLDGIMNALSSFALMGGNKPSDLIPAKGQNTSDLSDDMWVDRYSGEIYQNTKLPDEYGGGFFKKNMGTADDSRRLDALNERHSKVGETPLMGALGVLELPASLKGLAYLGSTGIKAAYKYAAPKIGDAISDLRYLGEDAGSLLTGTAPRIEDAFGVGANARRSDDVPIYTRPDGSRTQFETQKNIDTVSAYYKQNPGSTNITASEMLGISISDVSRIKSYLGLQRGQDTKLGSVSLGRNPYNNDRMFVTNEQYEEAINLLTDGDLTQLEIASQLKLGETYISTIAKKAGFVYNKRKTPERTQDLQNMVADLNKLDGSTLPQATYNSKLIKQLKEKYGLSYTQVIDDVNLIKSEILGKTHGNNRYLKGLDFTDTDLTDVLKKFPDGRSVVDNMRAAGISEDSIKQIENVQNSVKVVANNKTVFEHAMPQSLVRGFNLDPNYLMFGERTTDFLNMYKARFDGPVKNLAIKFEKTAKKYRDGKISKQEYNSAYKEYITKIRKMETEVMDATDGYKIGYMDFVNGVPTPATPHFSALTSQIGDLGPQTTALINFFKNAKHHNALLKKYKNNPSNFPSLKRFDKSIESGKTSFETEAAKIYDQIKDFTTPKQFKNFYEKNKNNKFFQALFNPGKRGGIAKNLIPYKGSGRTAVPTAITGSLVGEAVLADEPEDLAGGGRVQGRAHYAEMTPDGVQVHHSFLSSGRDNTKPVINPLRMFADDNAPYNPELISGTAEYAVAQVLGSGDTEQDLIERRRKLDEAREEQDVIEESRDFLSSKKPLEFHFTELLNPRKALENPLIRRGINGNIYGAGTYLMELAETIVNGGVDPQQVALGFGGKKDESIPAQEGRIQFEEYFPYLHKAFKMSTDPLPETPTEQTYTSVIAELNKGMDRGLINLSYDIFDLAFAGLDGASGALGKDSDFAGALKKSFDNMDKTEPESWVGKISAIGTEFGVPGGTIFKLVNRFRKILGGAMGTNLFAQQTWNLKGAQKAGAVISNIIKRSGTGAVTFGINDFVAGSQYNSMNEYFGDNPLLFDEKLGYEPEDISDLNGNDLLMANFRNRLRFAADGAIIGGLFPLIGPAFKYGINPAARYVGGPAAGAAARVVGAGMTVGSKILATDKYITPNLVKLGTKGASLLGKDIISRLGAASASVFSGQNMSGQWGNFTKVLKAPLPKMEDWGMFKVTSNNPLEVGLKRFDKFLGFFRDRGNQTINNFYLTKRTEQFITAKSKEIEKILKSIEVKSYDLANGFLKTNNKNITSPQGELYFMEQVSSYLRGQIPISRLPIELQSMAKNLSEEFDTIRKSFKDVLPEGELKTFLDTNLKEYMRHSFAAFSNPKYKIIDDIDNIAMIGERSESTLATALGKKGLSGTKSEVDAAFQSVRKKDLYENALQYITKQIQNNPEMLAAAMKRPGGLLSHAKHHLKEIIAKTKIENRDPIEIMQNIARENLGLPELIIRTGDELPEVIKKFLGKQEGLRDSVVTTTASLLTQSANMRMYNKMLDDGLKFKWIFRTREEARAAGIIDPQRIASGTDGRMAGLTGEFNPKIAEHFASPEIATTIGKAEGGMFDDLYQNSFIQGLIAYKAGVQTMKTVFSPSTQARNFLSAGFFPLNMGHIGGRASVTDAFKMTMDDIFGAGRTVDEESLIKSITRKVELGVLDENIVVSELQAVLRDIKSGKLKSLSGLSEKINSTALTDTATKLYAGGDNVWKWYGHEYVMSQLRDVGFKNVDEVLAYAKRMFNVDMGKVNPMTGANKTMFDVIEEVAAYTVRETYPTYSKVPELVKVFRRIPFIGNFVSFPAEILRTSAATTAYGLKHVMDDNPLLRQIGYRTLMGQSMALGGVASTIKGIGEAYTGISGDKMDNWKKNFAPEFMRNSYVIPIGKIPKVNSVGQKMKDKDGNIIYKDDQFRIFDMSRFAPYDLITSSVSNIMNRFMGPNKERLDPRVAEGEVMREFFTTAGPLYDLAGGTFFGTAIGFEPILPLIAHGRDKNGVQVFKKSDQFGDKVDKFMAHWFKTVKPGGVASAQKVFDAIQGDVQKGSGVPLDLSSELFKLFGGSDVKIDMNSAFRYKIADYKSSFIDTKERRYIATDDFRSAGPEYLLSQYNQMNKEAFNEQYQFFKAVRAARGRNNMEEKIIKAAELASIPLEQRDKKYINTDGTAKNELQILSVLVKDSRLLSDDAIKDLLRQRVGKNAAKDILKGLFNPISTGIGEGKKDGTLDTRMKNIYRNNPGIERYFPESYFLPRSLEKAKKTWSKRKFQNYEEGSDFIETMGDKDRFLNPSLKGMTETQTKPETETPPVQVADSGTPVTTNISTPGGTVNPQTGLTSTEFALLSPSEQLIRKNQRGQA